MTYLWRRTLKKHYATKRHDFFKAVWIPVILHILAGPCPIFADAGLNYKNEALSVFRYLNSWGKTFGGKENDVAYSLAATADGGYVMAGISHSFPSISGYEEAWVIKLGPDGAVEWENSYGNVLWDIIRSIQQTYDGGYIATGVHYPPGGSQQAWVVKLDPQGEIDWQHTYGRDDHYDSAWSIQQTSDLGYILCGGTQSHNMGEEGGAWVLKLTESGAIEWQKFLGGAEYDYIFSVQQTFDGGYILAGGTYSYSTEPYFSDAWIVKMLPNGNIDWTKTYGGEYNDVAYSVKQTCDGGYVLLCWTSFRWGDVLVIKTDAQGNLDWQRRYSGDFEDVPTSMSLTWYGDILISGYTGSFGFGAHDGWILTLKRDGTMRWQEVIGGEAKDTFTGIVKIPFGYIAAGATNSFGAGAGFSDFWSLRITPFGPDAQALRSISMPSEAVLEPMEVVEKVIDVYIEDTEACQGTAQAEVVATSSHQTDLAKLPPRVKSTTRQVLAPLADGKVPWPIKDTSDFHN